MAKISLQKNEKINLTKVSDRLNRVKVILSWQTPLNVFPKYDLDVTAFLLGSNQKMLSDESIVFFNQEELPDGSVWKSPDEKEGGSEELYVDISKLSSAVVEISIIVTIHKAATRKQTFGAVTKPMVQIVNDETNEIIADFHLDDIAKDATSVQIGSFFQQQDEFIFQGLGVSYQLGLEDFVNGYSE
jgi:tellurium resistance protein TerD